MSSSKVATNRFLASGCRDSYYQFFLTFWPLIAAEKLNRAWYIKEACDELQICSERVFRDEQKEYDLIWNCPPGTSKSSIFSVLWQPWVWTRMPSARFITGSYAEKLALDLSRKSRDVVQSQLYKTLFPEIVLSEDQNTKGYWTNTAGGFRYAVGVCGSVIGMHAHFQAIDDPIDPLGALSDLALEESNVWMDETLSRRKVNLMVTFMALVQQRLHQNDGTGNLLEKGTPVKHVCLPCDDSWEIKPPEWKARYSEDGLLDPVRLPRAALETSMKDLGEDGYACQMGESPTPRGGAMFKVDRLHYSLPSDVPKIWKRGPVRYWDKASSQGRGSFTVGVLMAMDHKERIWILDVQRFQLDSGRREERIDQTCDLDGKRVRIGIEQEPGGAGKEQAETAARHYASRGYKVKIDLVRASKEVRAGEGENRPETLSVQVNTGNVILVQAGWNKAYTDEMRFFPRSKYKDQIDASSGGYGMISKQRLRIGALR